MYCIKLRKQNDPRIIFHVIKLREQNGPNYKVVNAAKILICIRSNFHIFIKKINEKKYK